MIRNMAKIWAQITQVVLHVLATLTVPAILEKGSTYISRRPTLTYIIRTTFAPYITNQNKLVAC